LLSEQLVYAKHWQAGAQKLAACGLKEKTESLLATLSADLFQNPPAYETPVGDLARAYSRRANIHRRVVYQVLVEQTAHQGTQDVVAL